MRAIVDVRLREMEQRLAGHKLKLVVPDDVKKWLAVVRPARGLACMVRQRSNVRTSLGGCPARRPGGGAACAHQAGADPVYGARPLNRLLNRELLNPLAKAIIEGAVHDHDDVHVALGADRLLLRPQRSATSLSPAARSA